jgi:MOSC domain-containing protein YiiM
MITVERLFISQGHNFFGHHGRAPGLNPAREVAAIECVAGRGIRGDRFFDYRPDFKGQVTLFASEVFEEFRAALRLPAADPAGLRRNILVGGFDLPALVGAQFTIQGIAFQGVEECRPCYWMDQVFGPGTETWLCGRGGLRCRILSSGWLQRTSSIVMR